MNSVLFAKMDQVFSFKKNKTLKKNTGKVREFCQSGKVGTMYYDSTIQDRDLQQKPNNTKLAQKSHTWVQASSRWLRVD